MLQIDATGYSPHELVYAGQKPTLLQTIDELEENDDPAHMAARRNTT